MRFTMNAFLPAAAADGFVYQKLISRYEQRPTSSQPMNNIAKLPARTSVSIEAANRLRYVKNLENRSSPCMYPIAKMWMSVPTPVTTSVMSTARASHWISSLPPDRRHPIPYRHDLRVMEIGSEGCGHPDHERRSDGERGDPSCQRLPYPSAEEMQEDRPGQGQCDDERKELYHCVLAPLRRGPRSPVTSLRSVVIIRTAPPARRPMQWNVS